MYSEMKIGMLVYLWYPKTKGTGYVYDTLFRPFMARHETEVDRQIQEIKAKIWDLISKYCQHFAEMGQGKFFEMLQYLAIQSLKFKQANQKPDDYPSTPNSRHGESENRPSATTSRSGSNHDSPRIRPRPVHT
ncbi:hypothetical protein V6N12_032842 [Hibiscus sabdariffa]